MKYAILVAAFLPVAAVAQEAKPDPVSAGIANPASQYCEEVGGTLEIRAEQNGEVGFCKLPDGRVVEEWELFREESASAPKAKGIEPEPEPVAADAEPDAAEGDGTVDPADVPGVQPLPPTTPVPEVLDTPGAEPLPEPDPAPDAAEPEAAPIADEPAPQAN